MYPVFLDLKDRECLVVGGGKVALRKVLTLLRSNAVITVISVEYARHFNKIAHKITMLKRPFHDDDITRKFTLVIGATNVMEVNRRISARAREEHILCNIVDQTALCSFVVPAVVRRGPVSIAISTSGAAPRLAKYCKSIAADAFSSDISPVATYLAEVRVRLFKVLPNIHDRAEFWEELFTVDPLEIISAHGWSVFVARAESLITNFSNRTHHEKK